MYEVPLTQNLGSGNFFIYQTSGSLITGAKIVTPEEISGTTLLPSSKSMLFVNNEVLSAYWTPPKVG